MPIYPPPLDRLLKLGAEPARRRVWPDYRHLGLTRRHVPDLIRMATDAALLDAPESTRPWWAPVHACRALGQLGAAEAVAPLWKLGDEHLNLQPEVADVLGMIGAAALPEATLRLFDDTRPDGARIAAATILANVAANHDDRREEVGAILAQQLADWAHQSPELNGFLVAFLVETGDVSAATTMEAAFAAGAVDTSICGTWEEVQVDLGIVPPPEDAAGFDDDEPEPMRLPSPAAAAKARARRKAAKQARKRNRRKK